MISFDQAKRIAYERIDREAAAERAAGRAVGEPRLFNEQDDYWTFGAAIPVLQEAGVSPGAILVSVDKKDGRIWEDEDFEAAAARASA